MGPLLCGDDGGDVGGLVGDSVGPDERGAGPFVGGAVRCAIGNFVGVDVRCRVVTGGTVIDGVAGAVQTVPG